MGRKYLIEIASRSHHLLTKIMRTKAETPGLKTRLNYTWPWRNDVLIVQAQCEEVNKTNWQKLWQNYFPA